ncbi:MAG: VWA domain-containing protein [Bacteroidota bacterium]
MERFRFENPDAFWLLLILVPLALLYWGFMRYRRKATRSFGEGSLLSYLMPLKPDYKHQTKFVMGFVGLAMLIGALANPQYGLKQETMTREGVDLMIAVDISRSMMAQDVKPNRLEQAREVVSRLIDQLGGDRVGLIIFAGNAYLQVPITSDYVTIKTFLSTISPEMAATQGTAIGEAIDIAEKAFANGESQSKAILIISDGEDHEGQAIASATRANENGATIYTLGIGGTAGVPIPIRVNNRDDYKRDRTGKIVVSKLNEAMLEEVADAGGGDYFKLSGGLGDVQRIRRALRQMEQQQFEDRVFTDYEDHFQWLLGL